MTDEAASAPRPGADRPSLAVAVGIAGPVLLALTWLWLQGTENDDLRNQLRHLHFWFLEAQFWLMVGLGASQARRLWRRVRPTGPARLGLAGAVLAAAALSLLAPDVSRIFYDEQIYQSIGQSLTDERMAQMCNEGVVEYGRLQCQRVEYNKQPYGYPYLLSLGYRLFGVDEQIAHRLNQAVHLLTVLMVYALARLWLSSATVAVWAAAVIAVLPEQLLWASTAAAEPSSSLMIVVALLAFVHFLREGTGLALAWATVTASFAVQFRPESILLIPILALILILERPEELKSLRVWIAGLVGWVACLPLLGHLAAIRGERWGAAGARFALEHLQTNLYPNTIFYVDNERFPAVVTALALVGVFAGGRWRLRERLLIATWFLLLWGIFLVFYAGSYRYGADVRYSLMSYAPLALLAGCGVQAIIGLGPLSARQKQALVGGLLAVSTLQLLPHVRAVGEEAWGARADVDLAREWSAEVPDDGIVLTHNPNMFLVWGRNAAQLSLATTDPEYVRGAMSQRFRGGIYIHWNFWCNVDDAVQLRFCQNVRDTHELQLIREATERDQRFALYRLVEADELESESRPP